MTKQVFKRDQVAHLWANGSQDSARVAGGNFWFTGRILWSYGNHFACGYRSDWRDANGRAVYLVNANTYSVTTSRHMHSTRRAIPSYAVTFEVPGLNAQMLDSRGMSANVYAAMAEVMRGALNDAAKRIKPELRAYDIGRAYEARELCDIIFTAAKDRRELRALYRTLPKLPPRGASYSDMKAARVEVQQSEARKNAAAFYARFAEMWNIATAEDSEAWQLQNCGPMLEKYDAARQCFKRGKMRAPKMPARDAVITAAENVAAKLRPFYMERAERDALRNLDYCAGSFSAESEARSTSYAMGRIKEIFDAGQNFPESETLRGLMDAIGPVMPELHRINARAQGIEAAKDARRELEAAQSFMPNHPRDAARHYGTAARHARASLEHYAAAGASLEASEGELLAGIARDSETERADILARMRELDAATIEQWRAGARVSVRDLGDGSPMLRLTADAKSVETSWGALVPVDVCPFIWSAVTEARSTGKGASFGDSGPQVGSFKLREIQADGSIVVGCHTIAGRELDYLATALGYVGNDASAHKLGRE